MATIIIITPPKNPKHAKLTDRESREFERPDGEPLADSLRAIADALDADELDAAE